MAKKNDQIREYIPRPTTFRERLSGFRSQVYEMIGRNDLTDRFFTVVSSRYSFYKGVPSVDSTRTIYALSRAIYLASVYMDRKSSTKYGEKYLLGALFGKPIVNVAAAFSIGSAPSIIENKTDADEEDIDNPAQPDQPEEDQDPQLDEFGRVKKTPIPKEPENPTIKNVNQWLEEERGFIHNVVRNSFRDGDSFVVMDDNGNMVEIAPEDVDVIQDPNRFGAIIGYDIFTTVDDPSAKDPGKKRTFVDEIRTTGRKRFEINSSNERVPVSGTEIEYLDDTGAPTEERLPVVHFANEREARQLYGTSEYQSLYTAMANYHALIEAGVKGNIYNSTPIPVLQGVKNVKQFMDLNFKKDEEGNYKLAWDQDKLIIGGEGLNATMLQPNDTSEGTMKMANLLFWLIAQNSETPEFAFGTAVQSSKASVSEQTPVLIKKAVRKQSQIEKPIRQLIELYIERLAKLKPDEFVVDTQFTIDMPDILDKDLNVNQQIVKLLLDEGAITLKTAAIMLNLGKYVKDIDEEIEKAQREKEARTPVQLDIFNQEFRKEEQDDPDVAKVKEALKNQPEKVAEMIGINNSYDLEEFVEKFDGQFTEEELEELGFQIIKRS